MGQFGFSYIGALYLLALLAPNLWWARCRPVNYDPSREDRILLGLYGGAVWLLLGDLVLGVGHIGIHLEHRRECEKRRNDR